MTLKFEEQKAVSLQCHMNHYFDICMADILSTLSLDPVRALLNVQALDIMEFRPPDGGRGFDCRISGRGGGSISGFSDFRGRSARNGTEGAVTENFEYFLKILPN